jgi:SAM-dependent methyltransferase
VRKRGIEDLEIFRGRTSPKQALMLRRALIEAAQKQFAEGKVGESANLVAPISPTPPECICEVAKQLSVTANDVIVDLGCGDGRWLIFFARQFGCKCYGYDLNQKLLERGLKDAAANSVSELVVLETADIFDDALTPQLANATVVIVYLFREGIVRMKEKLARFCSSKHSLVRIVSIGFAIPGWSAKQSMAVRGLRAHIYVCSG